MATRVVTVPVLQDNFAYLLIDGATQEAAAVDPAEPEALLRAAKKEGVTITKVLTTHCHWDHAGGNNKLKALLPSVTIVGGKGDGVEGCEVEVADGDTVAVGRTTVRVFQTPCHTRGHVLYYVEAGADAAAPKLFTGDTLFVAGCGRFFAGTPAEMHHALNGVIAQLPPATELFVGHEYTCSNLKFAAAVEPQSAAVRERQRWAAELTGDGRHTVPSTVRDELATNPFMRVHQPDVQAFTDKTDPVEVMGVLRERKNNFGLGAGMK